MRVFRLLILSFLIGLPASLPDLPRGLLRASVKAHAALRAAESPAAGGDAAAPPRPQGLMGEIASLESRPFPELWPALEEIKKAHASDTEDSLKDLPERVQALGDKGRLAAAAFLFGRSERLLSELGQVLLLELAREGSSKEARLAAIRLLRTPVRYREREAQLVLQSIAQQDRDVDLRIEAYLALWALDNHPPLRSPLLRLLEDRNPGTRAAAAMALAEMGYFQPPVDEILAQLRKEPSERGRQAELLLVLLGKIEKERPSKPPATARQDTEPVVEKPGQRPEVADKEPREGRDALVRPWSLVVEEVVDKILEHSLHKDTVELRDLYLAALKALVSSLDEYSAFQDPSDVAQSEANRLGIYWGIGAQLVKPEKNAPLVVAKSYEGGPAHAAGMRTGDRVLEVNGVTTSDNYLDEIKRITEGRPGDEVHLLVQPWDGAPVRRISLERGEVEPVPLISSKLLPENIGYIKIVRFAPGIAAEFEKELDRLEGLRLNALILDLRDNPGGVVDQALKIVDLFVGDKDQHMLSEEGPEPMRWYPTAGEKPKHPMFVLVNRNTASAAEVVAGILQDLQPATVIGQPTFGKGVKQTAFSLSRAANQLLGGEGKLVLTTSRFRLPKGRLIQTERDKSGQVLPAKQGGIEPNILAGEKEERQDEKYLAEITRVQYSPQVNDYILKNFARIKNLFAEGDLWDSTADKGFDDLYKSLRTTLRPPQVRQVVRAVIRRHLEDERPEGSPGSLADDVQLQRAILVALERLGRDPKEVPAYRSFADRLARGEARRAD